MSEKTLDVVRSIRKRLHDTARRLYLSELLFGIAVSLAVSCGLWLLLTAAESHLWMGLLERRIAVVAWLSTSLISAATFALPPLIRLIRASRGASEEQVAARIGERYPEIADRLVNFLHLSGGKSAPAPTHLLDGAVSMLGRQISPVRFENVEDFRRPRRAALWAVWPPIALVGLALAAPSPLTEASQRLLALNTEFEAPAPFALRVEPGDIQLTRGEAAEISAFAEGTALPSTATVSMLREGSEQAEQFPMEPGGDGHFKYDVESVSSDMRYRVEADGIASSWFEISVVRRPLVRDLAVRIHPPSYTGLPAKDLAKNRGDVTALRGSEVHLSTDVSGVDVRDVRLEFDSGRVLSLDLASGTATGSFRLEGEGAYHIVAESAEGVQNADPIEYRLTTLNDEPPSVRLVLPGPDETLGEDLATELGSQILDDFGFSRLILKYRLAESRYRSPQDEFLSLPISIETPRPVDQAVIHGWDFSETELDPVPGDVIEYYLEVWDNDGVSGPKSARSSVYRLRVPSLTERYRGLESEQDEMRDGLERMMDEAGEIREEFEQLREELRRKQDGDWQDRRQIEALQRRQDSMDQRVDELSRKMQDVRREMEENDLLSPETIETYRELERVVEEIRSPELNEALQQLQDALEQMDLGRMQESLQDFEFNEEQYRQRLERTLELFKKTRAMQQLEQAERLAQELNRHQDQLRQQTQQLDNPDSSGDEIQEEGEGNENAVSGEQESTPEEADSEQQDGTEAKADSDSPESDEQSQTGDTDPEEQTSSTSRERVADEQERLAEDMEELEEMLEETRRQVNETRSGPSDDINELREKVRQQELPQKMRESGEQIRQNQSEDAADKQQGVQQGLQQIQQQLGEMRRSMQGGQMQINLGNMRRSLRHVIALSQEQEGLQSATTEKGAGSPALRELARNQVRLAEGAGIVADSLQSLAADIPQMNRNVQRHVGEALREMEQATKALSERASQEAGSHQRTSMMHLNELALMLSDLLDQMMNQSGGGGEGGMSAEEMADQLRQMSQQQQQLNQQIQQMLNESQGERLSNDMQARMRQMAAQQDEIRRHLRQLSRDPSARDGMLNELNRIAEQMKTTIEELQRRGVDRETVNRQQQILTRLLEAEKSLQEREQDDQRRGRTGQTFDREGPPELERSEQLDKLRRDLIRALESDYSSDYQELIRRYFELLRRETEGAE